ncbi:MAG: metallophosphoesterase [Oscillospiraceae bacterium]|nr:metallophosphoesterase [Oscillospiraceae bacterium]
MERRHELFFVPIERRFRLLHVSDVHFSKITSHEHNARVTEEILEQLAFYHMPADPADPEDDLDDPVRVVCVTGDLISRGYDDKSMEDALTLLRRLQETAPVVYSLGNHEMDWPEDVLHGFLARVRETGVIVLDNESAEIGGVTFTGLTLPRSVFRQENGSYRKLTPINEDLVRECLGHCPGHPNVLLAHTPLGFDAYAAWGADAVLAGHIHGGIVRIGNIGLLSPERRFLPKYTKGRFLSEDRRCTMNVSAGIGKFRINDPPEVICIDLMADPAEEG